MLYFCVFRHEIRKVQFISVVIIIIIYECYYMYICSPLPSSSLKWLEHNSTYARYVHVPIGNVPEDLSTLSADLFYARHLLKNNHVLWASNSPVPDLGGKEEDDHRLMSSEQDHVLCLNFPAAYNTTCVEVHFT